MTVAKPTLKHLSEKINLVMEAKALFDVGDRVHVGGHPATGELGTVTKTNGHGHAHVTTDSGAEHKFDKNGSYIGQESSNKHLKLRTPEAHEKAKETLERREDEYRAKKEAYDKISAAHVDANDPTHRHIIQKLKEHSGDHHLSNLGAPSHHFDRHNNYSHSETESHVEPGHFGDLFHKIKKIVRIHNASPETEKEHGITHQGSIEYRYEHPAGGSNGFTVGRFSRHTDGHIEIKKDVHTGTDRFGHDKFEYNKVVKHID